MRVALYARVSTERQEQQGTIASQLDALTRWAREQHHDVVDAYVCVDDGYSGTRLDRPGLDRLRDGAEAGAFKAALVLCPDRLARKYAYQILILEELERFDVRVIFLDQPLSDDPQARLLTQIQGAVAEYERIKIAERYRRRCSFGHDRVKCAGGRSPTATGGFHGVTASRPRSRCRSPRRRSCGRSSAGTSTNTSACGRSRCV